MVLAKLQFPSKKKTAFIVVQQKCKEPPTLALLCYVPLLVPPWAKPLVAGSLFPRNKEMNLCLERCA